MSLPSDLRLLIDLYRVGDSPKVAMLTPPATDAEIAAYREAFGEDLPDELRQVYSVMGSGPFVDAQELMPVKQVITSRRMWDDIIEQSADPDDDYHGQIVSWHPGAVTAHYWKQGWVPFTQDGGGNGFALDLAPEPGGQAGQVINHGSDDDYRAVLAPSLTDLLGQVAQLIRAGRVALDDYGWLSVVGPDGATSVFDALVRRPAS
jgi:cell wall assembly regulator SMI1